MADSPSQYRQAVQVMGVSQDPVLLLPTDDVLLAIIKAVGTYEQTYGRWPSPAELRHVLTR